MTQDLELRVLTGIHAGARCAVKNDALIGSHGRCDVVLCDNGIAEEAARLRVDSATWRLSMQDDAGDAPQEVRFGTPLALGPVLLTVAHAGDAWPEPDLCSGTRESGSGAGDSACVAPPEREDTPAQTAAGATRDTRNPADRGQDLYADAGESTVHAGALRRRKGLGLRWAVGGLLIVLVFGSVASFPPSKVPSISRVPAVPATDTEALLRAQRLLTERGYAPRVRASLSAEQEVLITGWVRDDLEHDHLATTLSTIWPLPAMRVGKETDVQARMNARMQGLDVSVTTVQAATGDLAVRGVAGSDAARQEAYRRWREDVETSSQATMTLLLASDIADALNQAVAAAGLPAVASTWKDNAMLVDAGGLDRLQREKLKSVLDTLNPIHMNALRVDGEKPVATGAMPFRIQTVVGGRQPWVVLDDGTRIVVGGTHGAYRLTSVEDGSVIFDGPTTAVIPR